MPAFAVPAPIGGWNARDPLDAMPPTDAIELINWFPQAGAVYGRGGSLTQLTIAGGNPVDTLAPYTSATAIKLLAACGGKIYDVTSLSSATQIGTGFTSNVWQTAHFNNKLVFVNGADAPQAYDGTTLAGMTITGPTAANLIGVVNMKGRALYWEKAAAGFWYATAGGYQGALTYFPLDTVFGRGGYVVQIVTWSRDNGDGVDDMTAIVSSNGEALVWQGDDPGDATSWRLVGRYLIGAPLSVRAHCKVASAEILLTTDGFVSLDEAIVNQRTQESTSFGGKIIRASNSAAQQYRSNFGWECIYYPRGQMFLANIPIASGQFEQYTRNMNTGAWCRFTGWNARAFCVYKDRLYFGTVDGKIVLADTNSQDSTVYPYSDDGAAVTYSGTQAYVRLTQPGEKSQLTGVQLVSNIKFPKRVSVNVLCDYHARQLPSLLEPPEQAVGQWDVSYWDSDYWAYEENDPTNLDARPYLYSVVSYGFALAVSVRYMVRVQQTVWYSTNYLFRPAGV